MPQEPPPRKTTPTGVEPPKAPPPGVAQFVFRGTVVRTAAATMASVPADDSTIVAQVNEILHGPEVLQDYRGQNVTVKLSPSHNVTEGNEYVFHTNGWIFGESVAVVAVEVVAASDAVVQTTRSALDALPGNAVRARAANAELIIIGAVLEIRVVPPKPGAPLTEHDPEWRDAVVRIDKVVKGAKADDVNTVVVRFASSNDVRWYRAPKFSVGQEGLWMLGDRSEQGVAAFAAADVPKGQYLAIEPDDFYEKERIPLVLANLE